MTLAWLTPNVDQLNESQQLRTICVAGSLWYLVSGALELLAEDWNWEQFGTATPDEAATYFQDVRDRYILSQFDLVGQISAFLTVPDRWYEMNGQFLSIPDYPELANVAPDSWIGRGGIRLPDMTAVGLAGHGYYSGLNSQVGDLNGRNSIAPEEIITAQHAHSYEASAGTIEILNGENIPILVASPPVTKQSGVYGNGEHIPLRGLYIAIRWCIYAGR